MTIFAKNPATGKWSQIARRGIYVHASASAVGSPAPVTERRSRPRLGTLSNVALTELFCEPRLLEDRAGRPLVLDLLGELCEAIELEGRPQFEQGWVLIPADPLSVFKALQRIDPHWPRYFALIPSDQTLRSRAWRITEEAASWGRQPAAIPSQDRERRAAFLEAVASPPAP